MQSEREHKDPFASLNRCPSSEPPSGTRDVLPPESARWARLIALFAQLAERPATGSRCRRCSRTSACSSASARPPTSSARRCTTSSTRAAGTSRCGPRARRRWCGRSSSTARPRRGRSGTPRPNFRYERPQAGRYRQHHQVGVEVLGADDPDLDVEVIALARRLLPRARAAPGRTLLAQLDRRRRRPRRATSTALRAYFDRARRRAVASRAGQTLAAQPAAGARLEAAARRSR